MFLHAVLAALQVQETRQRILWSKAKRMVS